MDCGFVWPPVKRSIWISCVNRLPMPIHFRRLPTLMSSRRALVTLIVYFTRLTRKVLTMTTTTTKTRRKTTAASRVAAKSGKIETLTTQFRELRMPTFRDQFVAAATRAEAENLSHLDYLLELTTLECETRREGRIKRLMTRSSLPLGKSWQSFQFDRLPMNVRRQLETLRDGTFLNRRENILLFGKPGSGKSHALCALAEQLVLQGRSMLFTTCSLLVQQLLMAKRDLRLPKLIKQLSSFEGLIIDDLGYVQQSREEMEVLFTLLAERYERGSVLLTSNLAFSWKIKVSGLIS
ncbi:ATP-binding protein [Novipirellula aureliae]|uniref:ATP-binding protein n=1 Tax=Novipirellula aureliae TaxID=2527966 RepID=UPI0036F3169D